jgi:hypothetical protein
MSTTVYIRIAESREAAQREEFECSVSVSSGFILPKTIEAAFRNKAPCSTLQYQVGERWVSCKVEVVNEQLRIFPGDGDEWDPAKIYAVVFAESQSNSK